MSHVEDKRVVVFGVLAALIGVLVLLFVFLFVLRDPIADRNHAGSGMGGAGLADSSTTFSIEGNTTRQLSPGVRAPLDLTLTNPHDVAISVTDLRVTVTAINAPNADIGHPCGLGDFAVDQASRSHPITLVPRAASTLRLLGLPRRAWPRLAMLNRQVNQDGCQGATLTLAYAASGTLAS